MLKLIVLYCAVILANVSAILISNPDDLLVIYGNGDFQIIIKKVATKETIKTFTVQVEKATGGITIDYLNDLIFFTDGQNMYKIYLVDDNGNRKISTNGELFTNKTANHIEVMLCDMSITHWRIRSFISHHDDKMLYAFTDYYNYPKYSCIHKIDPESGSVSRFRCFNYRKPYRHSIYHNDIWYTSAYDGIYNSSIAQFVKFKGLNLLANIKSLSSFTIDKSTNRLFYIQRSAIRVLDGNLTITSFSKNKTRIVLADSSVTMKANAIAVHGKKVIWSSPKWNKLYIGELNENMNFILKKDIRVLDGSSYDEKYEFNNIMIFENNFKSKL